MSFSERHVYKQIRDKMQIESMDKPLRNGLWNRFYGRCITTDNWNDSQCVFLENVWTDYFKKRVDECDIHSMEDCIRKYFFDCEWNKVYDLLEFAIENYEFGANCQKEFSDECDIILKRERAGYRFVNNLITPIINEEEIQSIETAMNSKHSTVSNHMNRALEMFSDREKPDYRNSMAESIHAVEGLANIVTNNEGKTLAKLTKDLNIDPALKKVLDSIFGYASNEARHAEKETAVKKTFDDAKFMLVTCSAFINLIEAKNSN